MRPGARDIATVFVFYAALFLLTSSGRLASTDAGAELQAAMLLVTTGHLTSPVRPALAPAGWVEGTGGRFHEPHDLGPVLLLAPAAWVGHLASGRSAAEDFDAPPVESRVGASLTCAVWSALGCCVLFMAFAVDADTRAAFVLSLLLPATTMFWPYARTAWDVGAGAVAMCAFLYAVRRAVRDEATARDVYLVMAATVLAASFRYSLLPFLLVSVGALALSGRVRQRPAVWTIAAGLLVAGLAPSVMYNLARTGSMLLPANATPDYLAGSNRLTGSLLHGVWGLLASPNRGLLVFAPLSALAAGLPFLWRTLPAERTRTILVTGIAGVLYGLLMAKLTNWSGAFGWGPRLLLPVLPVVMYAASSVLQSIWPAHRRLLTAFILAAAIWQFPAVVTNWTSAVVTHPRALDADARGPYQHAAVWDDFIRSLRGLPLALPDEIANDPERLQGERFPDVWLARVASRSPGGRWAALMTTIVFTAAGAWALSALLRASPRRCEAQEIVGTRRR